MWRREEGICIVGVSNCTCINKQKAWCAFGVECGMFIPMTALSSRRM
jgi:hypothetical protein